MSFNTTIGYQVPTEIRYGLGIVEQLPEVIEAYSKKILLVSMQDIPALKRIRHLLESLGAEVTLFDQVPPNPPDSTIDEAAEVAKEKGCGLVVGLGGGSAIDTAKAASVMATHEGKAWDYTVEMGEKRRPIVHEVLPELCKIRPEKVAMLAKILLDEPGRADGMSVEKACETAIKEMNRWLAEINLNRKLSDCGIEEADLDKLANSISMTRLTRAWEREMDHEEVKSYYRMNL